MHRRWDGGRWLSLAYAFLCLALVSAFLAFGASFNLDAGGYSASHYAEDITRRQWVMAASLVMPVLAALSALIAMLVRPRSWERIEPAAIVLLASAGVAWMCWLIGVDTVERARYFSELFPG